MCIVLSVYFYENKIYLLFFSSLLGIVVAILLYLDFDTNISAILRTIMALFIAVYTYKKWKEKIVIEEEGESYEN
jgi:Na+/H+ antiporter NhaC